MKKFWNEFKAFAMKGNVIDLAVGVIIGAAFQGIVNSLVKDIISPLLGLVANMDFTQLSITIGDVSIMYGSFLTAVINFILMAFIVFLFVRSLNQLKKFVSRNEKPAAKTKKTCPFCQSEISIKAKRCPFCTSELELASEEPAEKA